MLATLRGRRVAFLARHGAGHRLSPSELNFRANIFGMKSLGVHVDPLGQRGRQPEGRVQAARHRRARSVLSTARRGRISTFFGRGLVAHVGFAHPDLRHAARVAAAAGERVGATVHRGGTYVCMEGPQFSTLAESKLYRSWGMDIIGMTNLQEAKLAREAEICYSTIALVTDYDCWHPDHDAVTVDMVDRDPAAEREDRAAADRRSRGATAGRAHVRVRDRAGGSDHHAGRDDSRPTRSANWRRLSGKYQMPVR